MADLVEQDDMSDRTCGPISVTDRFWAKVEKNGPVPEHRAELGQCWVWTSGTDVNGYGRIRVSALHSTEVLAHRISWQMTHGPIPDGLWCLHHCDNPPCVNPGHLFLGTWRENNADKISKGRQRGVAGARNPRAKLTEEQVREIRMRYVGGSRECGIVALAAEYGVSDVLISKIVRGQIWKDPTWA